MTIIQPILIYAELLSNIRQVSVSCSLRTPSSLGTKAAVSREGLILTINHDGAETSIRLPRCVALLEHLPIPKLGTRCLSWRLPLASPSRDSIFTVPKEQTAPWSAGNLQPESPITCRTCHSAVVKDGLIKVWKDLPSDNWAEMMEFWHCHKPQDHGHTHSDDDLTSKGYAASSRISAQPGVGFVDLTSFMLSESDICFSAVMQTLLQPEFYNGADEPNEISEVDESRSLQARDLPIFCRSCSRHLGVLNDQSSVSLFKWQVQVNEQPQQSHSSLPNLSHCISAMLLATIARSGCSKSIIMPMKVPTQSVQRAPTASRTSQPQPLLNIWVLNNSITFSSTEEARSPLQAVKVFYRMVSQEEANKLLDSMVSDVQDITLPIDAIGQVIDILNSSNHILPQSDRQFKEWTVGLVEKWDGKG
ncbi:ubiquitin-conjugating enzyme E2-binding protein [Hypoxylon sp. NC1633]|nr:ubiquitin-conjugating enzyme E2-binding protein [Hypoxylon sp. NC1633]